MADSLPIILVPGLNCSARLYAPQIAELWRLGATGIFVRAGEAWLHGLRCCSGRYAYLWRHGSVEPYDAALAGAYTPSGSGAPAT